MNINKDVNNKTSVKEFEPFKAIIAYQRTFRDYFDQEITEHYIEIRNIKNGKFQSAKPASVNFIAKIADEIKSSSIKSKNELSGKIPNNLLFLKNDSEPVLVWKVNSQKKKMFYKNTVLKDQNYFIPNTIIVFCPESLDMFVFCTIENKITDETQLFYSPYFNTKVKVCNGTIFENFKANNSLQEIVDSVTNIFFNSYFTEVHDKYYKGKNGKITIWKKAIKQFPDNLLRPTNLKIKKLYEKIQDQTLFSSTTS